MAQQPLIQIDLQQVIDSKLGAKARYVPRALVNWLKRTVHQDEMNSILSTLYPHEGAEFCDRLIDYLNCRVLVTNPEAFPDRDRRLIIVSNHPLGGLDGIAMISMLSKIYGEGLRFIVNDLLMAVKPLNSVFLPINKHGRQDRKAIADINQAFSSDAPVVIFPAGLVSRKGNDGEIRDLQWNKMFVNKAIEHKRDVLPVFFSGNNSQFFYNFARWRKRLGMKFNIEMIYLPDEMLKCRDKSFAVTVGEVIPWQSLRGGAQALAQAQEIKDIVYSLNL